MKTLKQTCKPRKNVFDRSKRDIVLDLSDLLQPGKIKAPEFFEENYITGGMKSLFRESFRRFKGDSQQGIFKLTQAMGGGKTHNLIALGLLAQEPSIRAKVLDGIVDHSGVGKARVVAFSGRESDAPLGIWGAIASQLGKKELFNEYYSPLKAPGQSAWVNLLKGEPLLILLDELPPYLENSKSIAIGNSDLSVVTATALSNLFVAVGKDELSNVCLVISDLKATYEGGSEILNKALRDLDSEVGRNALPLEPVALNTDELYFILRKRLFSELPEESDIGEVAQGYSKAIRDARQMDITAATPEAFASQIQKSYPFHPAIRDLYARFRENPGFQQTRGLIRLMRVVVARMWNDVDGVASTSYLIHAHDIDLNDRDTLAEISTINPTLDNAISHDIASAGKAVAELMDQNLGTKRDAQDVCKLLLVSSLANVPNSLVGLNTSEAVSYLCAPGRDISGIPKNIIEVLSTRAWYLHTNREGKFFFKNTQNLVAKIKSIAENVNRESSIKELRTRLEGMFSPSVKDAYQVVKVLPALDEIELTQDKVTMVIYEPHSGTQVHPDIEKFYRDQTFKNRVLFLTGSRGNLDNLIERSKDLKAVKTAIEELQAEKVRDDDPLMQQAITYQDKFELQFLSSIRETFTVIFYPTADRLSSADLQMSFSDNKFEGEKQIKKTLEEKQKFSADISSETFRKKIEQRLFTIKKMPWNEVVQRAAQTPAWQWHRMDALDAMKRDSLEKGHWRDDGSGYIEKPPFPKPRTEVFVQQKARNDETGEVTLKIQPVHADLVYFEVGQPATTGSQRVEDFNNFKTKEMSVSFLCIDSKNEHETGDQYTWTNQITLKYRAFQQGNEGRMELRSAPPASIRYTTDGSDPRNGGAAYNDPFPIPKGTRFVIAVAEKNGTFSEKQEIAVDPESFGEQKIDNIKAATLMRNLEAQATRDVFELLARTSKYGGQLVDVEILLRGQDGSSRNCWLNLTSGQQFNIGPKETEKLVLGLKELLPNSEASLTCQAIHFTKGQDLQDWVADARLTLAPGEVVQK